MSDPHVQIQDSTSLFQLVANGDSQNLEERLNSGDGGPDINAKDGLGRTLLHLAVLCEQVKIVELLLSKEAQVTKKLENGSTAIHLAVSKGNQDLVRLLLRGTSKLDEKTSPAEEGIAKGLSGLSLDIKEDSATSEQTNRPASSRESMPADLVNQRLSNPPLAPLHIAILNGDIPMIKLLVSSFNADIHIPAGDIVPLILAFQLPGPEAKAVFQTLLELGASVAQTLKDQPSTFHRIISFQEQDIVDLIAKYDPDGLKQALNQVHHQFAQASTPLTSAIATNNEKLAMKLLELGANPFTTYDDLLQNSSQSSYQLQQNDTFLRNNFKHTFQQPIILAARMEMVALAKTLLSKGADPSTPTSETQRLITDPVGHVFDRPETVVDIVHEKIKQLRGDYSARSNVWANQRPELQEKKRAAIEAMAGEFESLEDDLDARGGKFFRQLYPDISFPPRRKYDPPVRDRTGFQIRQPSYEGDDEKYQVLYKLASENDEEGIKKVTLDNWGQDLSNKPLQIAVQNTARESPFSTAVVNGHLDMAKVIISIAEVQYSNPQNESTAQAKEKAISSLTSPSFPAEKLKDLSNIVQSPVSTAKMITGNSDIISTHFIHKQADPKALTAPLFNLLLQYSEKQDHFLGRNSRNFHSCIESGNIPVLKALITHTGAPFKHQIRPNPETGVPELEARTELEPLYARPPLLQAAYKGNLTAITWFSDVEEVLLYYREFANTHAFDTRKQTLEQARERFLAKVKTWLTTRSELVLHCSMMSYPQYFYGLQEEENEQVKAKRARQKNEQQEREQRLNELFLDILSSQSLAMSLNSPSADGFYPLHLALMRHLPLSSIDILLKAGADITSKDALCRNILHLLLAPVGDGGHSHPLLDNDIYVQQLPELFSLFQRHISSQNPPTTTFQDLWAGICDESPGNLTPVARYLLEVSRLLVHGLAYLTSAIPVLKSIFAFSTGAELCIRDGKGDEILHFLARQSMRLLVPVILEHPQNKDPPMNLLGRENAAGKTPLEVAQETWWRRASKDEMQVRMQRNGFGMWYMDIVDRDPDWFDEGSWGKLVELNKGRYEKEFDTWKILMEEERKWRDVRGGMRVLAVVEGRQVGEGKGKGKGKDRGNSAKGQKDSKRQRTERGKGKDEISLFVYKPGNLY